jgi:acyl-CoA synthetase (AMP-forming)/AMP-acid ligase II/aryl carrier-like protein
MRNSPGVGTAATCTELLVRAAGSPRAISFHDDFDAPRRVEFGALYAAALSTLGRLQEHGLKAGDTMLLIVPRNESFLVAFWAALLGGIVPVPLAIGTSSDHRDKIFRIAELLGGPAVYTDSAIWARLVRHAQSYAGPAPIARPIFCDGDFAAVGAGRPVARGPADLAFIQFSSGSTAKPKGVELTHANLVASIACMSIAFELVEEDVLLSWMPLTHDMGLIGMHLMMLANNIEQHFWPTEAFARRPLRWTKLATRTGATVLSSPNFGLRHYVYASGNSILTEVDLSRVRIIFNGAEPISPSICEHFMERLAPYGLASRAMLPVYGLAEATLAVTSTVPKEVWAVRHFDRGDLTPGRTPKLVAPTHPRALALVSVGRAIPQMDLKFADDDGAQLPPGRVGHIWIRGPAVSAGYYRDPAATAATRSAEGWVNTGDIGLELEGEIYISGRAKEILFVDGQNFYPHDIEEVAASVKGIGTGRLVAAGCRRAGVEVDELTLFVDHRGDLESFVPIIRELRHTIGTQMGLEVRHVIAVPSIPRTTSGKIQRVALEQAFIAGDFDAQLAAQAEVEARFSTVTTPRTATEREVLAIFCEVMPREGIDLEANFIDLGLTSLYLLQIYQKLQVRWPDTVLLEEIFETPSIAKIARLVDAKSVEFADTPAASGAQPDAVSPERIVLAKYAHIEPLDAILARQRMQLIDWHTRRSPEALIASRHESGTRAPIFWCFQGPEELAALADALGPDQPLFGVRSGFNIMQYSLHNLDSLADRYAAEIDKQRPAGPLLVGGNCQGAQIARSVAQALRRRGRDVPLVMLMEESLFRAYDRPVALLFGDRSRLNPYVAGFDYAKVFKRSYPAGYSVDLIPGAHGEYFNPENVPGLARQIVELAANAATIESAA